MNGIICLRQTVLIFGGNQVTGGVEPAGFPDRPDLAVEPDALLSQQDQHQYTQNDHNIPQG
ncbi:hypothetical protein D3C75_1372650 [compost metagenome]